MINFVFKKKRKFFLKKKKYFLQTLFLISILFEQKVPVDIKRFAEIFSRKLFLKKISLDVLLPRWGNNDSSRYGSPTRIDAKFSSTIPRKTQDST